MLADLPGWEIHNGEHLSAEKFVSCIVRRQLCQRLLRAKFETEVDHENVRGVSSFWKRLNIDHPAHSNVELFKIIGRHRIATHLIFLK